MDELQETERQQDEPVDALIGRRVRTIRLLNEWSQTQLAARMVATGCEGWTNAIVAGLELGRRRLRLDEFGCLCIALNTPADRLLAGTDLLHQMRLEKGAWWSDDPAAVQHRMRAEELAVRVASAVRSLTGVDYKPETIDAIASNMFGRDLIDERDARFAVIQGQLPEESWTAALGHVTRGIAEELADRIQPGQVEDYFAALEDQEDT